MQLIVASIPLFFILIGIELVFALVLERRVYRFADSFADLGCGLVEQLLGVLVKGALFAVYLAIYANARLFNLPADSWLVFVTCFIGVDFLYYWFHRTSHEIGAFWAAHSVHHQSEEYNLTVALRQGAFQGFFSWMFYLPLALLGFSPPTFITCSALNTLYQFWIHTRLIGKLGPLEWVFNTPSHHRVHHGRNPRYIDRNHAGALIVWDRMFGTFVPETDEPVYGIVKPLNSVNPLWANFAGWVDLWNVARRTRSLADRLAPLIAAPGWRPKELGGPLRPPEVTRELAPPTEFPVSSWRAAYVFLNLIAILGTTSLLLARAQVIDRMTFSVLAGVIILSLVVLSSLLEGRPAGRVVEVGRVLLLLVLGSAFGPGLLGRFFGNS